MSDIDWHIVDVVCNGTIAPLTVEERDAALRRMADRMLDNSDSYLSGNKITTVEVARRLGVNERTVQRMKAALPESVRELCPVCRQTMWIVEDIVEPHPDSLNQECPMSNRSVGHWAEDMAAEVAWLAARLRAGDRDGVWDDINDMTVTKARAVMVVALAAIPDKPLDELYGWVEEYA